MKTSMLTALIFIAIILSCQSPKRNTGDNKPSPIRNEDNEHAKLRKNQKSQQSLDYNFSLNFPKNWEFSEFNSDGQFPVFNFFPSSEKDKIEFPITVHATAEISYVGVYPKGYGIELPMGDSRKYSKHNDAKVSFPLNSRESVTFLLNNGQAWGYFIVPSDPPVGWEEHGFVFAQVATEDFEARCFDKETGEELDMSECDPIMGDVIKRYGSVNEKKQQIIMDILQSLQFENISHTSSDKTSGSEVSDIKITNPKVGAQISSPLNLSGKARGNWFFEAEFTVELVNEDETIAETIVKAEDDWMTDDYVPFSASMEFEAAANEGPAKLIFKNSNPSGKPGLDKTFSLPVEIAGK